MNPREKIIYLLKHYYMGEYDTNTFVDEFFRIYNFETKEYMFSKEENIALKELSEFVDRFSQFECDLKFPNMFFNEDQVNKKANEVYLKFFSGGS